MKVLIGCEESGIGRNAFIAQGHEAYSNDLIPARDGGPHLLMCVREAITRHGPWDIIILHWECTAMAVCGNRWYGKDTFRHKERLEALDWAAETWGLAKSNCRVGCAFENPASTLWTRIGKPQYIQPHNFGHREVKKTGILTFKLPPLAHTHEVGPPPPKGTEERKKWERVWRMAKSPTRQRDRSESYPGIMDAMAEQWTKEPL